MGARFSTIHFYSFMCGTNIILTDSDLVDRGVTLDCLFVCHYSLRKWWWPIWPKKGVSLLVIREIFKNGIRTYEIYEWLFKVSIKRGLMIQVLHIAHHTPTLSGNGISWINMGKKILFCTFTCPSTWNKILLFKISCLGFISPACMLWSYQLTKFNPFSHSINNTCLECSSFNELRPYVAEKPLFCCNDDRFGGPLGGLGYVRLG